MAKTPNPAGPWYAEVTRYQWLVLVIASLGWIFDVFEGQVFVASANVAMPALAPPEVRALPAEARAGHLAYYTNVALAAFLLVGAAGGVGFGILADRFGRTRIMTWTILAYSAFTFLSALSAAWWHMAVFRFLVALGVGGEWAVASALVAEVFPARARPWSLAIFHASSVLGTYLAVAAGAVIVAAGEVHIPLPGGATAFTVPGWRLAFALGVAPALLVLWIRAGVREPERWQKARAAGPARPPASVAELFSPGLRRRTLVGVGLAAVGLATFWGTHIHGKEMLRDARADAYVAAAADRPVSSEDRARLLEPYRVDLQRWEMLGMFLVTTGGGLGLVAFGPLCERRGRRGAFLLFHVGALGAAAAVFGRTWPVAALVCLLPVFGFLTLGMHAGYAVYFPELFPTRLRGTGGGFCFNVGRVLAAPALFASGWLQREWGLNLPQAALALSLLFACGAVLLAAAPETRGRDLPE